MSALIFKITAAGRAAYINAQNTGTLPLTVSEVGVTDQAFTAAEDGSDLALPGELKRLDTFAGDAVAADTIHVSITDASADVYDMRGFALYFDDGTLFGLYGQADPIMQKSAQAMMLLAADVIFEDIDITGLTFGDTNFALPPATTDRAGIVELATDDETTTGTDTQRAVVPKSLKAALDARFGAGAPSAFVKSLLTLASAALCRTALGIKLAATFDPGAGNSLDADLLDGQHGAYYRAWANLTGVPAVFPPSAHQHAWTDITGKPETATRWPAWLEVTDKPTTFPPAPHSQDWGTILNIPATATRWPTWAEVTGKPTFGTASAKDVEFFAVAAQGAKADAADATLNDLRIRSGTSNQLTDWNTAIDGTFRTISGTTTALNAPGNSYYAGIRLRSWVGGWAGDIVTRVSGSASELWFRGASGSVNGDPAPWKQAAALDGAAFTGAVSAPSFASTASSRRAKHDIADSRYGLAEVLAMRFVEYRYKPEVVADQRLRFGVIVEELRPVAPGLVIEPPADDKDAFPTVDYTQLGPVIGLALQQYIECADARAEALQIRLAKMGEEMAKLTERLAQLEGQR